MTLSALGGCLAMTVGIIRYEQLAGWQWLLFAAASLCFLAIFWFRRNLSLAELDLETREKFLQSQLTELHEKTEALRLLKSDFELEVQAESQRILTQQQALSARLTTYHEWQEFPVPINLSDDGRSPAPGTPLSDLLKQDQELLNLLQQECEAFFERIRRNEYLEHGKFQLPKLRDDLLNLMIRCARIYQPQVEQPLLETSMERVLRAIARIALQWQVVLENLPLDTKRRNLSSLYSYIRQAVLAYGTYQTIRPYWSYANHAWYLGRLAFGANPITLGAWWLLSRIGTQGAQALAERVIQRQALTLLQDVVRVVGYEVADMYGGDFRHRDANWIFAAELTDVMSQFPLSRDSLKHGLREIGSLNLRSEYDRSYLIRCISNGVSAHPEQYAAQQLLSVSERRKIAHRLEHFISLHIHGKTPERLQKWLQAAEQRLAVKLSVDGTSRITPVQAQFKSAVLSLAGYLSSIKQLSNLAICEFLPQTTCWQALAPQVQTELSHVLNSNPPLFFEEPDIDPHGEVVEKFFIDFTRAAAHFPPRSISAWEMIKNLADYLRYPISKITTLWQQELWNQLKHGNANWSGLKNLDRDIQAILLDLLDRENIYCFYRSIVAEPVLTNTGSLYLLGTSTRLILFSSETNEPCIWWIGDSSMHCELQRNVVTRDCLLHDGKWLVDSTTKRAIRIAGPLLQTSDTYFQPLFNWKNQPRPH
jgi:hypothetical protein